MKVGVKMNNSRTQGLARVLALLIIMMIFLLNVPALATSLWVDQAADIYKSKVASEIGDLITIIIQEESTATQRASTETSQDSSIGGGPGLGIFDFVQNFQVDYDDQNSADGSTTRQGTLEARVTAQIIAVQPNGNLVLRGYKSININGENQEMEITGVIRRDDISADNTIESTYMTDVEINFSGTGVVGDKQKAGLLEQLFNWLF